MKRSSASLHFGLARVVVQKVTPQHFGNISHAHGGPGWPELAFELHPCSMPGWHWLTLYERAFVTLLSIGSIHFGVGEYCPKLITVAQMLSRLFYCDVPLT